MLGFGCGTCDNYTIEQCRAIFERSADLVGAWADECSDNLTEVPVGVRLDSSKKSKDTAVRSLRFPLYSLGCGSWDDDQFVNSRLTEELAGRA